MTFTLDSIVPWGRSFDEYVAMFALGGEDLKKRILGCGDGPAAFNATLTARDGSVVSIDPVYAFSRDEIAGRIEETFTSVMEQTRSNRDNFVWKQLPTVEALGETRMAAMQTFLNDYDTGLAQRRYLARELPDLEFDDRAFDLALCSHLLFLYSEQLDLSFHLAAVKELCRVAREVRIFPLLDLDARPSPHLEPLRTALESEGYCARCERVPYEFQHGGHTMLRVTLNR